MIDNRCYNQKLFVLSSESENYSDEKGWKKVNSSNKNYCMQGATYISIDKRERYAPLLSLHRITGIVLGIMCCIASLGFAYRSKIVKQFFSGRQFVRILKPGLEVKTTKSKDTATNPDVVFLYNNTGKINPPLAQNNDLISSIPKENPVIDAKPVHEVKPEAEATIEVKPVLDEIEVPANVDFNKNSYKPTKRIFESPLVEKNDFTPLTEQQVLEVLNLEPELKNLDAAQGHMKAYESILKIHQDGIPFRLDPLPNQELKGSMQFILSKINQEKDLEKKKSLLIELAGCVEDCVPVTQGRTAQMHMKLASIGGFDKQIESFISTYKDKIADQVIYQLFPEMQKLDYAAKHHGQPWLQFPHMKTGFLALMGNKLGLNTVGAEGDPNRNTNISDQLQKDFEKIFCEKVSLHEIIKEFIIDVNGRNGQIEIATLSNWCVPGNLGDEAFNVFYDGDPEGYPSYSPEYKKEYGFHPYLKESTAYLIFEKLGYLAKGR